MYKELRQSSATTKEINERTIEIHDNLNKEKRKDNETYVAIERSQRQLSVAMDRVEAVSGASHASLEEVKELILSVWQGSPLIIEHQLTELERNAGGVDNELAELRSWLEPV